MPNNVSFFVNLLFGLMPRLPNSQIITKFPTYSSSSNCDTHGRWVAGGGRRQFGDHADRWHRAEILHRCRSSVSRSGDTHNTEACPFQIANGALEQAAIVLAGKKGRVLRMNVKSKDDQACHCKS
jgi:hypothetical protein